MPIALLRSGRYRPWLILSLVLAISACASLQPKGGSDERLSVAEFYRIGHEQLARKQVFDAMATVDRMELIYPLNAETSRLQLELIEGYYDAGHMDHVIASASRFITMFPGHGNVDQAYYLRGLANFARGVTALSAINDKPDPSYAREAVMNFEQLLQRFPRSQYSANAQHHADYLRGQLKVFEYRQRGEFPVRMAEQEPPAEPQTPLQPQRSAVSPAPESIKVEEPAVAAVAEAVVPEAAAVVIETPQTVAVPSIVVAEPVTEPAPVVVAPAPPVAVAAPAPAAVAAAGASGPFHTIQVAAFDDFAGLKRQIAKLGLTSEVSYFMRDVKGKRIYAALYGRYPNAAAAKAEAERLQKRTGLKDVWLRQRFSFETEVDAGRP